MQIVTLISKWNKLIDSNYDWIVKDFIVDLKYLNKKRSKFQTKRRDKNKEKIKQYNAMYYEQKRRKDLWCIKRYKK